MGPWHRVRILLLGGTGFIGRWLARRLSEAQADLVLVVRDERSGVLLDRLGVRATVVAADLTAPGTIEEITREHRPSVTFNLAGYGVDPSQREEAAAMALNGDFVARLGAALNETNRRSWRGYPLVHVGSALEYGDVEGVITEATSPNPTTLYGRSKLRGTTALQAVCNQTGLPAVTARLFMIYGPGEREGRLLPQLVRAAAADEDIPLTAGTQRRDFTYVEDAVEGLLRLALGRPTRPGHEVVNVNTGVLTPVRSFVELAARELGIDSHRLRFGALPTRHEEMTLVTGISNTRLRQLTGWSPATSVEAGIQRTIQSLDA